MILEYIFSGPFYLRLAKTTGLSNEEYSLVFELNQIGINKLHKETQQNEDYYPLDLSILHNAFTEKAMLPILLKHNKLGFKNIYSDSGGLQVVTRGMKVDDAVKRLVYETQSQSDYAMCFDEIPSIRLSGRFPELYIPSKLKECSVKTAENIIEQIEFFSQVGSKAKVFYIIQGNTIDDMEEWFSVGVDLLEDWHWEHIAGLSLADGNGYGILERVETVAAYHKIRKDFGERYTKNHLHLLGVGSPHRLIPIMFLCNSGFIDPDIHLSFDSTSHSRGYIHGSFLSVEGKKVGWDHYASREEFKQIVDYFIPSFREVYPNIDEKVLLELLFSDCLKPSKTNFKALDLPLKISLSSLRTLCSCRSVLGFSRILKDDILKMEHNNKPLGLLKDVTDYESYNEWHRVFSTLVPSRRIPREQSGLEIYMSE